ncbi:MAG: mechanosensitive ion channel family protein [Nitriliruptoraceae bacterium]
MTLRAWPLAYPQQLSSVRWLAQDEGEPSQGVCGEGSDVNWLCELVLERTDDASLARVAGFATTVGVVLAIIVGAYLLTKIMGRLVNRFTTRMERRIEERLDRAQERGAISDTQRFRTRRFQRLRAVSGALRGAIGVAIWVSALFLLLGQLGLPLQPLLAGAGLIGVLVGFGAQQLVRDVLAGIAMLIEDQYGVGDFIEVEGNVGQVERVGLRSTAFRDIDGVVHHVLNGYLQRVGNLSQAWARATFDVPMSVDTDVATARDIIWDVATGLTEDPVWSADTIGPPEIWGVQHWGPEGVTIRVVIPTKPLRNWDLVRQLRERLKAAFDEAGIRMPSQLVDLGGQRDAHAVLTRDLTEEDLTGDARQPRPRRVPTADGDDTGAAEDQEPQRDQTAELRLQRGPEPRPD